MKNPKQTLLKGMVSTAVVFTAACSTLSEPENAETPNTNTAVCQQEESKECPRTERIKNLRDSILKGEKIKHSEEENTHTALTIEPE